MADLVCEFGQNLTRVIAALGVVTVLPGVLFAIAGGVTGAHDIWDTLLFSAARMTAATPGGLQPANALVEWIGVAQGFLGIALLGLFGFVLGNTLRQS